MAERKANSNKTSSRSPKPKQVEEEARPEVERDVANVLRTSGPTHALYFVAVILGAALLNLLMLVLISGG